MIRTVIVVAALCCFAASAQDLCTFTANINITTTDIAPAKFCVSAADCCNTCWGVPECQAAIYSNYFCHLKGTTGSQQVALGTTLILMQRPTTPPTNAPATSPPPPAPTTAAPTAPPATPAPATPTTAAPSGTVTIVREVQCDYSNSCSQSQDYSCSTAVYYNNVCQNQIIHQCQEHAILVAKYPTSDCSGPASKESAEPLNVCKMTPNDIYEGHYCDVQPAPTAGLSLVRTLCPYGCDDGQECQTNQFTTGACKPNPFQTLSGQSVIASCFEQYVVYSAYDSLDCSGSPSDSRAEPVGTKCFLNENQEHIQNVCG